MSCSLWFILGFSTQSQDQTVCQRSQLKDNFFVCFFYQIHRFSIWSRAKASPQYPLKTAFNAQCEHLITSVCFNFLSRATLILKILTVCSWFWLSGKCSVHLASAESNKKTQLPPFNVKDVQWCYFLFWIWENVILWLRSVENINLKQSPVPLKSSVALFYIK